MEEETQLRQTDTAKILKSENTKPNGDWTVVVPRRGKKNRRTQPKRETIEQADWAPPDLQTDPAKESKLMQKIHFSINRLESSDFYRTFQNQIHTPEVLSYFTSALGSEMKMQMVIYGIGSIDSYEIPRLQLALAILLKRTFDWIGDVEVFDPILSKSESRVLEDLGISVLSVNEQGRREVSKPTLFFMPHCEAILYDNLLHTNWKAEFLNRMVLFGNSFKRYTEEISLVNNSFLSKSVNHVFAIQRFSIEIEIDTVADDFFRPFHDSSWHFFNLDAEMDLELKSIETLEDHS